MTKHKMSPDARKRGVLAIIRSKKTRPAQREGMRRYAKRKGWM